MIIYIPVFLGSSMYPLNMRLAMNLEDNEDEDDDEGPPWIVWDVEVALLLVPIESESRENLLK